SVSAAVSFLPPRSTTRSPSDCRASVSPGASRNASRTVLGITTRPALSSVTMVFIGGILEWEYPFINTILGRAPRLQDPPDTAKVSLVCSDHRARILPLRDTHAHAVPRYARASAHSRPPTR